MDDAIEIPVVYRGEDYVFNATIENYGYINKIKVELDGRFIMLEQDEEQQFRAISDSPEGDTLSIKEKELIREIIGVLNSL